MDIPAERLAVLSPRNNYYACFFWGAQPTQTQCNSWFVGRLETITNVRHCMAVHLWRSQIIIIYSMTMLLCSLAITMNGKMLFARHQILMTIIVATGSSYRSPIPPWLLSLSVGPFSHRFSSLDLTLCWFSDCNSLSSNRNVGGFPPKSQQR